MAKRNAPRLRSRKPSGNAVASIPASLAHRAIAARNTVRSPTADIAAHSVALALEMVEGGMPTQDVYVVRAPELIVRESTGPARSRRR